MPVTNMIFSLVVVLAVLGGTNYYVARRIYQCLRFVFLQIYLAGYAAFVTLFVLFMIFGFARTLFPISYGIKRVLGVVSTHWMGFFIYMALFFVLADAALLAGNILKIIPHPIPHHIRFFSGLTALVFAIVTAGYGIYHANRMQHISYDIQLEGKDLQSGIKIVLISDLHLGAVNSEKRMEDMVRGINEQKPDVVCIAGDIFDNDYYAIYRPDEVSETLKRIDAEYGVYACPGNHDGGETTGKMLAFLERSNITLLADEYITIAGQMILAGRLDSGPIGGFDGRERGKWEDVAAGADLSLPVIVMDHDPDNIDGYGSETDLILSGHTHKGHTFPGNLFTKLMYTVDYGYYQKDSESPHVIVTSGAGTWGMPMRVGTDFEIVSITLH